MFHPFLVNLRMVLGFGFTMLYQIFRVQTCTNLFNYNMDKTTTQYRFSTPLLFLFGSGGSHSLAQDASELLEHPEGKRAQKQP